MVVRRIVLSAGFILVAARIVSACQAPPVWDCQLGLQGAVATAGESFTFDVTVPGGILQGIGGSLSVNVSAETATIDWLPGTEPPLPSCRQTLAPIAITPPGPFDVTLDSATIPDPANTTTWHQQFVLDVPADAVGVHLMVYIWSLDNAQRLEACIPVYTPAAPATFPTARLVRPAPGADAGGDIPFELIVDRNGFDPDVPLLAWVERVNVSDAMDLFPLMPATLSTGHALPAGDSVIPFVAHVHVHEPCICGMSNKFHVLLTDDAGFPLFESSLMAPDGISAISVDHAPMAFLQHVTTSDASGDGILSACEAATITVRMIARNPWIDYEMDAVLATLPLPPGFQAIAGAAHFHDNPMDAVTPDAAEMNAGGQLSIEATQVVATVGRLGDRLSRGENPPRVFPDMYEVEGQLTTPPEGLSEGALTLAGVTTTGTPWRNGSATGLPRSESSAPLVIAVGPPVVAEISGPGAAPLLMLPDKISLSWSNAAPAAVRWNVRRGVIPGLRSRDYGSCVASALASATWSDAEAVAPGGFFYIVTGTACGLEGSPGVDSRGAPRLLGAPCP